MSPSGIQVNKTAILVVLLIIGAVTVYKYPHIFHLTSAKKSEDGSKAGSDKGMATEDIKALDALKKSAENVKVEVRKIPVKVGDKVRNYNFCFFYSHISIDFGEYCFVLSICVSVCLLLTLAFALTFGL